MLWSDCVDAQADLGIRFPYMPETRVCLERPIYFQLQANIIWYIFQCPYKIV